ncbi:MAG: hypothetical protein Tsb0032_36560 [Kiloniellaceae bacterium]
MRLSALTGGRSEAIMAAVWHDDRLLVVRHAYWRGLTLPGGHVEGAETPAEAAARELREEVGIDLAADRFRPFGRLELRRTRLTLLECRLSAAPPIAIDNREITAAAFMAPAAIACPSRALRSYLRAKRAEAQTA